MLLEGDLVASPHDMKVKQNGHVLLQCDIVGEMRGKLLLTLDTHKIRPSYTTIEVQKHILSKFCAADTCTVEFCSLENL